MSYRPRTSEEINMHHINTLLKKAKKKLITKPEAAKELNNRFARLQNQNIGMYEEMYPKYINLFKTI